MCNEILEETEDHSIELSRNLLIGMGIEKIKGRVIKDGSKLLCDKNSKESSCYIGPALTDGVYKISFRLCCSEPVGLFVCSSGNNSQYRFGCVFLSDNNKHSLKVVSNTLAYEEISIKEGDIITLEVDLDSKDPC